MNKREEILKINKRNDLSRIEKTQLIQKLFTPELPKEENEATKVGDSDFQETYLSLTSICHADNDDLESANFQAVACHVTMLPKHVEEDDFCAFTRENLHDYNHVGSIVVSRWDPSKKGKLEWIQLCNGKPKGNLDGVHFFNVDLCCQWIKEKGCVYIECPMCRRGTNKRRAIREEEIETMSQLTEERQQLLEAHDYAMMTFKDQQIVEKACREFWDDSINSQRKDENEAALKMVLQNWIQHRTWSDYRDWFYVQCKESIKAGNSRILTMLFEHYDTLSAKPIDNFTECLQICCEQNDPECMNVCLNNGAEESEFCSALHACARNKNETMFKRVAQRMKEQQEKGLKEDFFFFSPDLFKSMVQWDNVEAMRTIFNNRWKTRLEPHEIELINSDSNTFLYQYFEESGRLNDDNMDFEEEVFAGFAGNMDPPVITRDTSWGDENAVADDWDDDDDSWGDDGD